MTNACAYALTNQTLNPNPTMKELAIVSIQLIIVTCLTHPDKFIQDVTAPFYNLACQCGPCNN